MAAAVSQRAATVEPFYLTGSAGDLFCMHWPVVGSVASSAVMFLPAFADEMNKARRMFALLARALQDLGVETLSVDLTGTGDSEGDFGDATLACWYRDLEAASEWLRSRGVVDIGAVALRGGALLAAGLSLPRGVARGRLALWQPIATGRHLVSQFLRLRVAEALIGGNRSIGLDTRAELQSSGRLEIAGYDLTARLAGDLESLDLRSIAAQGWRRVAWFEIVGDAAIEASPAAQRIVSALAADGCAVDLRLVPGEPFWATPEIVEVPELVSQTARFMAGQA